MSGTLATLDPLLKDVTGPAIINQLVKDVPTVELFEKVTDFNLEGRQVIEPVQVNRNRGHYAGAEGGAIPSAGKPQVENFHIPMKFQWGQIKFTQQLLKASKSNKGSFARAYKLLVSDLEDGMRIDRNFYLNGDGRAIRAFANGAVTTTAVTVDSPGGIAGATNGSRFINVGDWVAAINPTTGALRQTVAYEVTAVATAGTSLTIGATGTWTDNDYIVKAFGSDASLAIGDTEWNHAPMGLAGMVDNGTYITTYFGLSRTSFPILNSTIIPSVGALSADVIQRGLDVSMELGGQVSMHLMAPATVRAYLAMMEADRRYTQEKLQKPDAGTVLAKKKFDTGLTFGGIPIWRDPMCPYGVWYGLDLEEGRRYVQDEGSWVDEDGSILYRHASEVDTFEATFRIYENYAHLRPNKCFALTGITSNVVVVHQY